MRSVDLLVFDLDGTLVRSDEDLAAAVNHSMKLLGLPTLTLAEVRGFVGDGSSMLMKRALGTKADIYFQRSMSLFKEYYRRHSLDHTALYPHVQDVLSYFDQKKKIIVTNKMYEYAANIAEALGIADYFLEIIGEDSFPFKKPEASLLKLIMEKWHVSPNRTVVIGDGINDILLAKRCGAISCSLLNGITDRKKLLAHAPDLTCEDISELTSLFE